ncbi:hypothetical protein NQ318_022873 [Aromia moschata]|uniref:Odorant receptor n=1 Tax=Aromia moschata TaxID=1265417 RepID=A0AAV8XI83_9CUCU|nr:hypothetical protein NQ318_022873 [Aromia moschata]
MYMFLSDFEQFGKPPKFDKYNNILNKIGKYHIIYTVAIITLFASTSKVFKGDECRRDNQEYGYKEVCGLIANTWLPFDIDYFPAKQIYLGLQFFGIYYMYMLSANLPYVVLESVIHIAIRLDHVKERFIEALNEPNPEERRKKFNFTVEYHSRVLNYPIKCVSGTCEMNHFLDKMSPAFNMYAAASVSIQ